MGIRFNPYNVTNGGKKSPVWYRFNDYGGYREIEVVQDTMKHGAQLWQVVGKELRIIDNSDAMTDYFEAASFKLNDAHPLFTAAYAAYLKRELRAKNFSEKREIRWAAQREAYAAKEKKRAEEWAAYRLNSKMAAPPSEGGAK